MSEREVTVRGRTFTVVDNGEKCFVAGEERPFWDVFEADGYDPNLLDLIDRLFKLPGGMFVDVGAWVGAISLYAAAAGAIVVAIDPDPVAFTALTENRRRNPSMSVLALRRAIVPYTEPPNMPVPLIGPLGLGLTLVGEGEEGATASAAALPALLGSADIDPSDVRLVKIDIEGGEVALLPRLAPWLAGHGIAVIASMHGTEPDPAWFAGFTTVSGGGPYGDVVALPFATMDSRGLGQV